MTEIDKPNLIYDYDGALVMEWIKINKRFGISIEQNIEEACWWYIDENPIHDTWGHMPKEIIECLKKYFGK